MRIGQGVDAHRLVPGRPLRLGGVEILREALAKAESEGLLGTDDAQLVEALGVEVRVVPGDADNLKITLPGDLAVAERILFPANEGLR